MLATAQQILEIKDIKKGALVLKDNSLRAVLAVSSINFALKSDEEQEAIIYQFQNFLNSLDFSIQVLIQSRRINLTAYIDELAELEKKQPNELLRLQTENYRKFIESLAKTGTIMTKSFYVIVPFYPVLIKTKKEMSEEEFEKARIQLLERVDFVAAGLKRCGLNCMLLGTEELIDLFWAHFHPEEAEVGYHPGVPKEIIL